MSKHLLSIGEEAKRDAAEDRRSETHLPLRETSVGEWTSGQAKNILVLREYVEVEQARSIVVWLPTACILTATNCS